MIFLMQKINKNDSIQKYSQVLFPWKKIFHQFSDELNISITWSSLCHASWMDQVLNASRWIIFSNLLSLTILFTSQQFSFLVETDSNGRKA